MEAWLGSEVTPVCASLCLCFLPASQTAEMSDKCTPSAFLAGCYVPCDPGYPDDRLAIYLEDGGASILLTSRDLMVRAENLMPTGRSLQVRWEARVGKADQFGHSSRATHLPAFLAGVCHRL